MIPNCQRHRWDRSEDECRQCGDAFCENCLVYMNGANARPLCINCALKMSGVRGSKKVRPSRRERRARARASRIRERSQVAACEATEELAATEAAATDVDLTDAGRRGWVSLDAASWDVGTI